MDSLITAAARAVAGGNPLSALKRVACATTLLLVLRRIAMAQHAAAVPDGLAPSREQSVQLPDGRPTGRYPARAQMPRLTDPPEDAMAYLGYVPVEKFLGGISRFQKDVYPKHQDLFEKLAMGHRPEALFITCADARIDPCLLTQTKPGELFICRVIGNVVPPYPDALGGVSATIDYACGVLQVPGA